MGKKQMTYEEARKKLSELQISMKSGKLSVEDSLKCCEEAERCYRRCREILDQAKQKIEIFRGEES